MSIDLTGFIHFLFRTPRAGLAIVETALGCLCFLIALVLLVFTRHAFIAALLLMCVPALILAGWLTLPVPNGRTSEGSRE